MVVMARGHWRGPGEKAECPGALTYALHSTQEKGGRRRPPGQVGHVADWDGRGSGLCIGGPWPPVLGRFGLESVMGGGGGRPRWTANPRRPVTRSLPPSFCLHPLHSPLAQRCFCPCLQIRRKDDSGSFGQKVRYFPSSLIS